jgi:hypothetical protein
MLVGFPTSLPSSAIPLASPLPPKAAPGGSSPTRTGRGAGKAPTLTTAAAPTMTAAGMTTRSPAKPLPLAMVFSTFFFFNEQKIKSTIIRAFIFFEFFHFRHCFDSFSKIYSFFTFMMLVSYNSFLHPPPHSSFSPHIRTQIHICICFPTKHTHTQAGNAPPLSEPHLEQWAFGPAVARVSPTAAATAVEAAAVGAIPVHFQQTQGVLQWLTLPVVCIFFFECFILIWFIFQIICFVLRTF